MRSDVLVEKWGFEGMDDKVSIGKLLNSKAQEWAMLPEEKGVYAVIAPEGFSPEFAENVDDDWKKELEEYWVKDTNILYFGKVGKEKQKTKRTLRKRIREYIKSKLSETGNHRGGKNIWHLKNVEQLYFIWKECKACEQEELEGELIERFKEDYKQFPFANLKSGNKKKTSPQ